MRSQKMSARVGRLFVWSIAMLIALIVGIWISIGRANFRRNFRSRWRDTRSRAIAARRYVARWWSFRVPVAEKMAKVDRTYGYVRELMIVQLLPHECDLVRKDFEKTESLLKRARVLRRRGRFGSAHRLVDSADRCIKSACNQLERSRAVLWSEVSYQ
jgi:hypothetical protein